MGAPLTRFLDALVRYAHGGGGTILSDLVDFGAAVSSHWFALMGGGLMLAIGLYERFKRNAPIRIWLVLMSGFVLFATFEAWRSERRRADTRVSDAESRVTSMEKEVGSLRSSLTEKSRQIADLQGIALRRDPILIPPPNVSVFRGGGPLPTYPLCPSASFLAWEFPEWGSPSDCNEVGLAWNDIDENVHAYAVVVTRTSERGKWVQVRIWNETDNVLAVEGPRSTEADFDKLGQRLRLRIPPLDHAASYRMELRNVAGGGVSASGHVALVRQ